MGDVLSEIPNLINSPPLLLASGLVMWGTIVGASKAIDDLLTKDAKFALAVSILDVRVSANVKPWTEVFRTRLFEWLFGPGQFTLRCVLTCTIMSITAFFVFVLVVHPFISKSVSLYFTPIYWIGLPVWIVFANFGSLLPTRLFLKHAPYRTMIGAAMAVIAAITASVAWVFVFSLAYLPWFLSAEDFWRAGALGVSFREAVGL